MQYTSACSRFCRDCLSYMYPVRQSSVSIKYVREGKQKERPCRTRKLLPKLIFKKGTLRTVEINRKDTKGLLWNGGLDFRCSHWILSLKVLLCLPQPKKKPQKKKKKKPTRKNPTRKLHKNRNNQWLWLIKLKLFLQVLKGIDKSDDHFFSLYLPLPPSK